MPLIASLGLENKVVRTGGLTPPSRVLMGTRTDAGQGEPDRLAETSVHRRGICLRGHASVTPKDFHWRSWKGMAAGLPVAATRISGNIDVVTDGVNGLLVEPADESALAEAILRMLSDDLLRQRMAGAARRTASRYGWVSVAQRYVEVYEAAIAQAQ